MSKKKVDGGFGQLMYKGKPVKFDKDQPAETWIFDENDKIIAKIPHQKGHKYPAPWEDRQK